MKHTLLTLSVLVLFALSDGQQECGRYSDTFFQGTSYIVGGSQVNIADSIVSLQVFKSDEWWNDHTWKHVCGGTLLNDRWVLTAAHCGEEYRDWGAARVSIGSNNLNNGTRLQQIRVKRVVGYPGWRNQISLDIALIELEKEVVRDELVSPACVSTLFSEIVTSEYCAALGWGKRGEFEDQSTVLKTVSVNLMSNQQCARAYRNMNGIRITSNNLCAGRMGERGHGICRGDLGGPLFCRTEGGRVKLVGVATNGALCGSPQHPGIYVRVEKFIAWIRETTGDQYIGVTQERPTTPA